MKRSAMKKQEMKNLLFEMLNGILTGTDFRLKKSEDGFVRRIAGGRQMLGLPLLDYNPEFEFSLNICVRLDAVEEVFHQFSGSSPRYHSMSDTTITRLEHFTGGSARYKVTTAADVASVGGVLSSIIRDKIVPFFNEHQDVEALDRDVNCQQPGIDITQNPSGAMHAVILACLAGNKDFERVVAKHQTDMELAPEVTHPFNRLVEYLKTREVGVKTP
jgi:hypothetical protein